MLYFSFNFPDIQSTFLFLLDPSVCWGIVISLLASVYTGKRVITWSEFEEMHYPGIAGCMFYINNCMEFSRPLCNIMVICPLSPNRLHKRQKKQMVPYVVEHKSLKMLHIFFSSSVSYGPVVQWHSRLPICPVWTYQWVNWMSQLMFQSGKCISVIN